jgi:hypothetical protein
MNASLRSRRPNVERAAIVVPPCERARHRATSRRRGQAPRTIRCPIGGFVIGS